MSQLTNAVRRSLPTWLAACALLVALAAFALVWVGRASADEGGPAPDSVSKSVSTAITKADAVDATGLQCIAGPSFSDMPGMLVSFRVAGNSPRAVIVLFQSVWHEVHQEAHVRLTIDGVVQSGPEAVAVDEEPANEFSNESETHGFNFISDNLAPGLHVARIQWRSFSNQGLSACAGDRSLIVLHK